jgi:hypothetical protein
MGRKITFVCSKKVRGGQLLTSDIKRFLKVWQTIRAYRACFRLNQKWSMAVNKGMNKLTLRGQTIVNAFTSFCGNCIVLFINSKAEKQAALKRGAF